MTFSNRFPTNNHPLLIQEEPVQFLPTLGGYIGENEALFLQKLQEQLSFSQTFIDGVRWVKSTLDEWHLQCFWMSKRTLQRVISHLRSFRRDGEVFRLLRIEKRVEKHGDDPPSSVKWYAINYDEINRLVPFAEQYAATKKEELLKRLNLPPDSTREERIRRACPEIDEILRQLPS